MGFAAVDSLKNMLRRKDKNPTSPVMASSTSPTTQHQESAPIDTDRHHNHHGHNHHHHHHNHHHAAQSEGDNPQAAVMVKQQQPRSSESQSANSFQDEAQKMVEEQKEASSKLPTYEGLERYALHKKMGDGAFSNVYRAIDTKTNEPVAVKVVRKYEMNHNQHLNSNFKKRPRVTERANILKEVQIMRQTNHENIIALKDFQESQDYYYLILELMPGGELFHQIVKLTYFSEQLSRHVILQVAQGIRHLHVEKGVVHRDIKPENLLFERIPIIPSKNPIKRQYDEEKEDEGEFMLGIGGGGIGKVKIADFGLSKIVWNEETMTPCGTVGYTAPEIVKDERYSMSVDMWALGCVLYTLLCGFPPFFDESVHVLTEKVARGYYTFLSPWWDDISDSAKDLITHLLCVDPEQRYDINQFLNHPWCRESPQANSAPSSRRQSSFAPDRNLPIDSPLLDSMRHGRKAMASPGVAQLKEAFDVTYAVHRMEEEGARRRNVAGGAGIRSQLLGLNEEEEEDEGTQFARKHPEGSAASQAVQGMQAARQRNKADAQKTHQPATQQHYQGYGGVTDRRAAEQELYGGRAGNRDRGKHGFELNITGATLLGRRNAVGKPSPLSMPAGAASPMHIDVGA